MIDTNLRFHPDLQGEFVPASTLRQHPRNANNGDVEGMVESLLTNGCYRAVLVSDRTVEDGQHYVVAGNTLYEGLITLAAQMIPVSWVHCETEVDELRIVAVDNELARRGIMDPGLELEMVEIIMESDRGLVGSGYTDERYAQMVEDVQEPFEAGEVDVQTMEFECSKCGHINEVPL